MKKKYSPQDIQNTYSINNHNHISQKMLRGALSAALCMSFYPMAIGTHQEAYANNLHNSGFAVANAGDKTTSASDFEFDESTGTITKYTGSDTDVVIPAQINDKDVEHIGDQAFYNDDSSLPKLTRIVLPAKLKTIGVSAFEDCDLRDVFIPDSVTTIKDNAFKHASNSSDWEANPIHFRGLKSVTSIGEGAFAAMHDLSIDVPALQSINDNAFEPRPDWGYSSGCYIRLFTGKENKHNLQSKPGLYLVNPAVLICRATVNGAVLKEQRYLGKDAGDVYNNQSQIDTFFSIGSKALDMHMNDSIDGFLRPLSVKETTLTEQETMLDFEYKPFKLDVPLKINKTTETLKGVTEPGAQVTIKKPGRSYYDDEQVIATINANSNGTFTYTLKSEDKQSGKIQIEASLASDQYSGKSLKRVITFGDEQIEGVTDPYIITNKVKTGANFSLPIGLTTIKNKDDKEIKVYVTRWEQADRLNDYLRTGGVYTFHTTATEQDTDSQISLIYKLTVTGEEKKAASKTFLQRAIVRAEQLMKNTTKSVDGSNVGKASKWTDEASFSALKTIYNKANSIYGNKDAKQDEVNAVSRELTQAITIFESSLRSGKFNLADKKYKVVLNISLKGSASSNIVQSPKVSLKNRYTGEILPAATISDVDIAKATYTAIFVNVPYYDKQAWEIIPEEPYIATNGSGSRAADGLRYVTMDLKFENAVQDVFLEKGYKVTYDADVQKGTLNENNTRYFLSGEKLLSQPYPITIAKKGYIFKGYVKPGTTNLIGDTDVVLNDMTLSALFEQTRSDQIVNESTPIGGVWTLGDFEYAQDTEGVETKGNWIVQGFSETGKNKVKTHKTLYIPSTTTEGKPVKAVGMEAFSQQGLKQVNIPEGIEGLYPHAFYENDITTITLPETGFMYLGSSSLLRNRITSITLPQSLERLNDGCLSENRLTEIDIPAKVKKIVGHSLSNNPITKVTLHEGLEEIGDRAFYGDRLVRVDIPKSLKKISDIAFEGNIGEVGAKVGLHTSDGTNPKNLKDSNYHIINPTTAPSKEDTLPELSKELYALQRARHDVYVSTNGNDVPANEKWISEELANNVEDALYQGYYLIYGNSDIHVNGATTPIAASSNPNAVLSNIQELQNKLNNAQKGSATIKNNWDINAFNLGLPETDVANKDLFAKDIEHNEFTIVNTANPKEKQYRFTSVLDAGSHLAHLNYRLPENKAAKYKITAPVGMVFAKEEAGKLIPDNTDVNIIAPDISGLSNKGVSAINGKVVLYDLGDKGKTTDKRYETVLSSFTPTNSPAVTVKDEFKTQGYTFIGWSTTGQKPIIKDLAQYKVIQNQVLKAVYEKNSNIITPPVPKPEDDPQHHNTDEGNIKDQLAALVKESMQLVDPENTSISADGKDIVSTKFWVTKETLNKFKEKLIDANFISEDHEATTNAATDAYKNLKSALETFKAARKPGLVSNKSDNETPGGNTSGAESNPSSGSSGSDSSTSDGNTTGGAGGSAGSGSEGGSGGHGGSSGSLEGATPEEPSVPSFDQATKRIAGETAEDTMQAIVKTAFPDPVKEVVLATSEGYWDALSANSLAGSLNAPVLLTKHGQLPEQTIAELKRLKTSKVVVCGGENAISNDVVAQLKALNIEVERVAGNMASDTANDIAKKLAKSDTAVVATSWGYEDALSAASFAYAKKAPIFLANYNTATLDASNIQTMKDKGVKKVYIVGGTAVVSPEVEAQLSAAGITVERIAGETAYDTSAKLATKLIALGMSANNMAIATGWGYTDALAGAALCGKQNSVMVLADNTNQTAISDVVAANKHAIKNYYIFGGTSVVGDGATDALKGVFTGETNADKNKPNEG